jgi:hypothetical protein
MNMRRGVGLTLIVAAMSACTVDKETFYDTAFPCPLGATRDACGTTRAGKPMVCYPGSQLGGGLDFCTEQCDPDGGTVAPGFTCTPSRALLKLCTPDPAPGTTNGCPIGLNCYRTDLVQNTGVCLMMPVCTHDSDCTDSRRPKCAATLIHDLSAAFTPDNLNCLQADCGSSGASCAAGESCGAAYYNIGKNEPAICVPNCLGNQDCPPNYGCAQNPTALGAPPICLPGFPGERCNHDQDCLLGTCKDTMAGFNECVLLPCVTDTDCAFLDVQQTFACGNGQCVGLGSFHGVRCVTDTDCSFGQQCIYYGPFNVDEDKGECRAPCAADMTCPVRAGVPQVCLDHGAGGCYPGEFALPCTQSSECLSAFTCLAVAPDPRTIIDSPTICTTTCATDDDCRKNPVSRSGFCQAGVCRMVGQVSNPCDRNAQCSSDLCVMDPNTGLGQCAR